MNHVAVEKPPPKRVKVDPESAAAPDIAFSDAPSEDAEGNDALRKRDSAAVLRENEASPYGSVVEVRGERLDIVWKDGDYSWEVVMNVCKRSHAGHPLLPRQYRL